MKRLTLLLVAILIVFMALWLPAGVESGEESAVRQAIEHYFRGHATGDREHFKKVFHPDSKLFWVNDGNLDQRTSADYIARAPGAPPADEAKRKRRIVSIDITGNAAVVKLELDYPGALITDYMSLLKIDGTWKIVNKMFYVERR
ncbi:MAG: nuclear transport factor 2 family protein [Blastocatellia bacterium]|nr:nuclear transport factor 2 family protein [Blastocatellia bacterium]